MPHKRQHEIDVDTKDVSDQIARFWIRTSFAAQPAEDRARTPSNLPSEVGFIPFPAPELTPDPSREFQTVPSSLCHMANVLARFAK